MQSDVYMTWYIFLYFWGENMDYETLSCGLFCRSMLKYMYWLNWKGDWFVYVCGQLDQKHSECTIMHHAWYATEKFSLLRPCRSCYKKGQCQWLSMKGAPHESLKPHSSPPVMDRKVHVPFLKSSFSVSRTKMRHSNQPSSSSVSRSTSREASGVSDTRPVGGQKRRDDRKRKRGRSLTHTQIGRVNKCRNRAYQEEDKHPVSQRPQAMS